MTAPAGAPAEVLATFERWYAAHETGDLAALADVLADSVRVHSLFRAEPARGRPQAVAHFQGTTGTFGGLQLRLVSQAVANPEGTVLAEVRFVGRFSGTLTWGGREHRGTGQPFDVPGALVLHTHEQRVTSVRTLFDRDDWLRQIGVLSQ